MSTALTVCGIYIFAMAASWLLVFGLPSWRAKQRAKKLRIGNVYVLDKKNPFEQTRCVITEIKLGYVEYRYMLNVMGKETLSSPQSTSAKSFAGMYVEIENSGEEA